MINKEMEELEEEVKLIKVGDKYMSIKEILDYIQDEKGKKRRIAVD